MSSPRTASIIIALFMQESITRHVGEPTSAERAEHHAGEPAEAGGIARDGQDVARRDAGGLGRALRGRDIKRRLRRRAGRSRAPIGESMDVDKDRVLTTM